MLGLLGTLVFAATFTASVADAQLSPDWARCVNEGNRFSPDVVIDRCSAVIRSGKEQGSNLAAAYSNRGNAYDRKGDYDRAIADHSKAIEINPRNAIAYDNRGNAYAQKGDYDRAIADYSKAITINPRDANPYDNRGLAYANKGDYDRAIADHSRAIEINPRSAIAYDNRGHTYARKGDYDRAIADYSKAIEINPGNTTVFRSLGLARFDNGDFKGASEEFLRSIELGDDVYAMLFRYLARARDGGKGEDELEANTGRLKSKRWPYAVTELYLGKRSVAATLDAAIEPNDRCEAHFYVGEWHVLKSSMQEAEAALKVAAETCPKDFVEYSSAMAEIKRLKKERLTRQGEVEVQLRA